MSKDFTYTEVKEKWKSRKSNLKESKNLSKISTNEIFKLIYGQEHIYTSLEKEVGINQVFADMFANNEIKWEIKIIDLDQPGLIKLLEKYLNKTYFDLKLWQVKFKSGIFGKYGMLIVKKVIGEDEEGKEITEPQLIPVQIISQNVMDNKIFELEIERDDLFLSLDNQNISLRKKYSLSNNQVKVDCYLINDDTQKIIDESELNDSLKEIIRLNKETLDWDFIPISILNNNLDGIPRTKIVESKLKMLDKFDEELAILPAWERGALLINSASIDPQNLELQNEELMKNIVLKGFNQFKVNEVDGTPMNLNENIVVFKPKSIIKNVETTRNSIWEEIKTDLGLSCSFKERNQNKENESLVISKQYLISPNIEREKILIEFFLKDLAKKFLYILSTCSIKDGFPSYINWKAMEIFAHFDLKPKSGVGELKNIDNKKLIDSNLGKGEDN